MYENVCSTDPESISLTEIAKFPDMNSTRGFGSIFWWSADEKLRAEVARHYSQPVVISI